MKTILVPTDGSVAAEKALDLALDLARQHQATIKLMHVLLRDKEPDELLRLQDVGTIGEEVLGELRRSEQSPCAPMTAEDIMSNVVQRPTDERILRKLGEHVLNRAKARVETAGVAVAALDLADGAPATEIVATAGDADADMIVMGTRGLRNIDVLTFGSVSQEVCRTASCTCVAVH